MTLKGKFTAFAVLCVICALVGGAYLRYSQRRLAPPVIDPATVPVAAPPAPALSAALPKEKVSKPPKLPVKQMLFRCNILGPNFGKLGIVSLDALDKPRYFQEWNCERVSFTGQKGVCLSADRGVATSYKAEFFDGSFLREGSFALAGPPTRTRISPDNRIGAVTVFTSGHGYGEGAMSTQTLLFDLATGTSLADLETFTVRRGSETIKESDFNFWGVTFCREQNKFYATLATGGERYLVKGDLQTREAQVLYKGIECPALSPDQTRVAFKKRSTTALRVTWQLAVLNLATLKETTLLEKRSIDDQVEWLDDRHILYALLEKTATALASTDIWVLPTDAGGPPKRFLSGASSPAVF